MCNLIHFNNEKPFQLCQYKKGNLVEVRKDHLRIILKLLQYKHQTSFHYSLLYLVFALLHGCKHNFLLLHVDAFEVGYTFAP